MTGKSIQRIPVIFFIFVILTDIPLCANSQSITQVKKGNFSLPTSQQPGPLIGFGQNIVNKHDLQYYNYINHLHGNNKKYTEVVPTILYGIRDDLSMYLQLPIAAQLKNGDFTYHGIEQFLAQFEYTPYNNGTEYAVNQFTIVSNLTINKNQTHAKNLKRSSGPASIFVGFTASHTDPKWYPFTCIGAWFPIPTGSEKAGILAFYGWGLSGNICYKADHYMLNWMIELDGIYQQKNKVMGVPEPNFGGNTIILGPSVWFSTQRLIIQVGLSGVVYEHLYGIQNKSNYYLSIDIAWKF